MLRSLGFGLLLCCGLSLAQAAEPLLLKFSHVVPAETPKGKAIVYFKRMVERRSNGLIQIEIHPNGELFREDGEFAALQSGTVHMLAPSLDRFASLGFKEFDLFDLPFVFPDKAALYTVTDGAVGKKLLAQLETQGILGLAYWDSGFKQISATKPVRQIGDLRGLKLRVQPSKILEAQMKMAGAVPQPLGLAEMYPALLQGKADGAEYPLANFCAQNLQEIQPYLTISNHGYLGYAVVTNKAFWQALPKADRQLLDTALAETTMYERQLAQREHDLCLKSLQASGKLKIVTLSAAERQQWKKTLAPVQQKMASYIGATWLKQVSAATR